MFQSDNTSTQISRSLRAGVFSKLKYFLQTWQGLLRRRKLRSVLQRFKSQDAVTREAAIDELIRERRGNVDFDWTYTIVPLCEALQDAVSGVRKKAAQALEMIADRESVAALCSALYDKDVSVRCSVAKALAAIGDIRAVEPLCDALNSQFSGGPGSMVGHFWFEMEAARALGAIGNARAVDTLLSTLKGSMPYLRVASASALGQIRDAKAIEPLCAALDCRGFTSEAGADVRASVVQALGRIGDARALRSLCAEIYVHNNNVNYDDNVRGDTVDAINGILSQSLKGAHSDDLKRIAYLPDEVATGNCFIGYSYTNCVPLKRLVDQDGCSHTNCVPLKRLACQELVLRGDWTPLHKAAALGRRDDVNSLLGDGADINAVSF